MKKILMLHGPNHNMFGHRDKNLYGTVSYEEINEAMRKVAEELQVELEIFQSNHEGAFIDKVQEAFYGNVDAVIANPGGWTNTSAAVKDALDILTCPRVEVHMSNTFRKHGGTVQANTAITASAVIIGGGINAYTLAVRAAAQLAEEKG